MTKNKKILIIVIAVLLIAVISYFIFRTKKTQDIQPANVTPPNQGPAKSSYLPEKFPLDINMQGENVLRLQKALNRIKPTFKISEDGILGYETKTKLLTTLPITLSALPMKETNFIEILKQANNI